MTSKEKAQVLRAINLIHHEDKYHAGMRVLCKLIGQPVRDVKVKKTTIYELMRR